MPEARAVTPADDSLLQEMYASMHERLGFTLSGESARITTWCGAYRAAHALIPDHRKETHMSDPYLSEIRMFGGNFAPLGWALCNGAMLNIAENAPLYALLGTTYGGDGQTTFAVPDLCSRIPIHMGTNPTTGTTYPLGQAGGSEMVTLTTPQLPVHSHQAVAVAGSGNQVGPQGALWAGSALNQFTTDAPNAAMAPNAVSAAGGSQPHDNMMPSLTINFIICTSGIYPSQN